VAGTIPNGESPAVDDLYRINVAKTEFREAYNTSDVDRLVSLYDEDGFTDMSHEGFTTYHQDSVARVREIATALFAEYFVHVSMSVTAIVVQGDMAYDFGWHEFTLRSKNGGDPIRKRERYLELWRRKNGESWKIALFISNGDVKDHLGGLETRWFLSENLPTA